MNSMLPARKLQTTMLIPYMKSTNNEVQLLIVYRFFSLIHYRK